MLFPDVRNTDYYQDHYSGLKRTDGQNTTALGGVTDTEELLAEDYDELDSLEKKEIQEQLSEDSLTGFIFTTGKGYSERLGSDGNSSPRSEGRSTPSNGEY